MVWDALILFPEVEAVPEEAIVIVEVDPTISSPADIALLGGISFQQAQKLANV